MAKRATLILLGIALLAGGVGHAADPCDGAPDATPCDDNGDGCVYNDGRDRCLAGVCASPPPCSRTTFTALPRGMVQMDWAKDPTLVKPGEFCEGEASVTVETVAALTGVLPPSVDGLVQVTRMRKARKTVPPTGKVRLKLHLNNLGRLLLRRSADEPALEVHARMTLTTPDGKIVGANRLLAILRR